MDDSHADHLHLSDRRCYSTHTILDEDGWVATASLFHNFVRVSWHFRWGGGTRRVKDFPWHRVRSAAGVLGWRYYVAQFVRKAIEVEGRLGGERAVDEEFARHYPALAEYLTLDWLEGAARETSTLGISVDGGQWKARLADRDSGLVTFISDAGFYGVLEALEGRLAGGTADWRRDQFAKPKKLKRGPAGGRD